MEIVFITDYAYWKLTNGKIYGLLTTDKKLIQGTYDDNVNMYMYICVHMYTHTYMGLLGFEYRTGFFPC